MTDKIKFDAKFFRIQVPKKVECEHQVSKNDVAIIGLEKEIRNIKFDRYHDPKDPKTQQTIKENEQKIRDLEHENSVRKRCQELNVGCFEVACSKCETLPLRPDGVHRAEPIVRRGFR